MSTASANIDESSMSAALTAITSGHELILDNSDDHTTHVSSLSTGLGTTTIPMPGPIQLSHTAPPCYASSMDEPTQFQQNTSTGCTLDDWLMTTVISLLQPLFPDQQPEQLNDTIERAVVVVGTWKDIGSTVLSTLMTALDKVDTDETTSSELIDTLLRKGNGTGDNATVCASLVTLMVLMIVHWERDKGLDLSRLRIPSAEDKGQGADTAALSANFVRPQRKNFDDVELGIESESIVLEEEDGMAEQASDREGMRARLDGDALAGADVVLEA